MILGYHSLSNIVSWNLSKHMVSKHRKWFLTKHRSLKNSAENSKLPKPYFWAYISWQSKILNLREPIFFIVCIKYPSSSKTFFVISVKRESFSE